MFTEKLKDYFTSNKCTQINQGGDLSFSGEIISYNIKPFIRQMKLSEKID